MTEFICEYCDTQIINFGQNQSTGCSHYPISLFTKVRPKLEKPGKKVKTTIKTKHTKKRVIEKPKELHCRRCNLTTGTECYRHCESFRKSGFGKGGGQKCDDKKTAYLCSDCDEIMSPSPIKNLGFRVDAVAELAMIYKHAEEWWYLMDLTWCEE